MCLRSNETGSVKTFICHSMKNLYCLFQNDTFQKLYTVSIPGNSAEILLPKLLSVDRLQPVVCCSQFQNDIPKWHDFWILRKRQSHVNSYLGSREAVEADEYVCWTQNSFTNSFEIDRDSFSMQCKTLLDTLLFHFRNASLKHAFIKLAAKLIVLAESSWN